MNGDAHLKSLGRVVGFGAFASICMGGLLHTPESGERVGSHYAFNDEYVLIEEKLINCPDGTVPARPLKAGVDTHNGNTTGCISSDFKKSIAVRLFDDSLSLWSAHASND